MSELADHGEALARRLADAIENDDFKRKPGLTKDERRASIVAQLRRGGNPFCRRVLELIGEPEVVVRPDDSSIVAAIQRTITEQQRGATRPCHVARCGGTEVQGEDEYGSLADGGSYEVWICDACHNVCRTPLPD